MFEYDARADPLAERVPDRLAERACAFGPLAVGLPIPGIRHRSPVRELVAIDDTNRSVSQAELTLGLVRDHCDGPAALRACDFERRAAKTAGRAPDENGIARLDDIRRPSHQHPIRG